MEDYEKCIYQFRTTEDDVYLREACGYVSRLYISPKNGTTYKSSPIPFTQCYFIQPTYLQNLKIQHKKNHIASLVYLKDKMCLALKYNRDKSHSKLDTNSFVPCDEIPDLGLRAVMIASTGLVWCISSAITHINTKETVL